MSWRSLIPFIRKHKASDKTTGKKNAGTKSLRRCGVESLESRRYLASDIHLGAVYYEDATGEDQAGDTIAITFQGGAAGTQLAQLTIDTDKLGDGLTIGDTFFDTASGGAGAFGSFPFTIVQNSGIDQVNVSVVDGGMSLAFTFVGFDAGDKLIFSLDVDEQGFIGSNAVAEGNEFEGSKLTAAFTAATYHNATAGDMFLDFYNAKLNSSGLALPNDDYVPPGTTPSPVRTAGAFVTLEQLPLPILIAGTVYEDANANHSLEAGDPRLAGVTVSLWQFDGGNYVNTGRTVVTDAQGNYQFSDVLPGRYRLVESQLSGYLSFGATAGTVLNVTRGSVLSPDVVTDIDLVGGDESVRNNFSEVRPGSIAGRVHADRNGDCLLNEGESPLAGVTIYLLDAQGSRIADTVTNANGQYTFGGLMPGEYGIEESQPAGYFDGDEDVGTAGGSVTADDIIRGITLVSGTNGLNYHFCEIPPAEISGRVYNDADNDGLWDVGENGIAGVTIALLNSAGNPTGITTLTAADGTYVFHTLLPGVYGVAESQPGAYLDGSETIGTAGGTIAPGGDKIVGANLQPGTPGTNYNFGEILPASIRGRVHVDRDGNCDTTSDELPLNGITVYLLNANGARIAQTVTDVNGEYIFNNLTPGVYGIEEVQPVNYFDGDEEVGAAGGVVSHNDVISGITILAGMQAVGYEFCELTGVISGYVFQDGPDIVLNPGTTFNTQGQRDGLRTQDDTPLAGVRLRLGDSRGLAVLDKFGQPYIVTTNAAGYYEFTGLGPGTYTVLEDHPFGYIDGLDTAGSTGGIAINPGVQVLGLEINPNGDAIAHIPLTNQSSSMENNFSEIVIHTVTQGDPPLFYFPPPPIIPQLPSNGSGPFPGAYFPPIVSTAVTEVPKAVFFGSNGAAPVYTWHLSVLDAGAPRKMSDANKRELVKAAKVSTLSNWSSVKLNNARWRLAGVTPENIDERIFGESGAIPVSGDFNGDGKAEVGVFLAGDWYVDLNGNGKWDDDDLWAQLGKDGDRPVTGDWDGDGKTDIGVFGTAWAGDERALRNEAGLPDDGNAKQGSYKNIPPAAHQATKGERVLKHTSVGDPRSDLIDHVFEWGSFGDVPVVGDFNGDGIDSIGIFRNGKWQLDTDGDGTFTKRDESFFYGETGDVPISGDFNGDGVDEVGIYRNGVWYLDVNGNRKIDQGDLVLKMGQGGEQPVVGDWNGDGVDQIGLYESGSIRQEENASPDEQAVENPESKGNETLSR